MKFRIIFAVLFACSYVFAGDPSVEVPKDGALIVELPEVNGIGGIVRGEGVGAFLQNLPEIQESEALHGRAIEIVMAGGGSGENFAFYNPYIRGNTYHFLVEDLRSEDEKLIVQEAKANRLGLIFALIRSAELAVLYIGFFPDINVWQGASVTAILTASNLYWSPPKKWGVFQNRMQLRLLGRDLNSNEEIPVHKDIATRLLVNLTYGSILNLINSSILTLHNPLLGPGLIVFLRTLVYGLLPNALIDETVTKWATGRGERLLTQKQNVKLTNTRHLLYGYLNPQIQKHGTGENPSIFTVGAAELSSLSLGVVALSAFAYAPRMWNPIGKKIERLRDWHHRRSFPPRTQFLSCTAILTD